MTIEPLNNAQKALLLKALATTLGVTDNEINQEEVPAAIDLQREDLIAIDRTALAFGVIYKCGLTAKGWACIKKLVGD